MKKERLKKYWEYKGCKKPADFARLIGGIAASNISEIDKRDNNSRLLFQIKNTPECSDLNIDWLLTGEGQMLKNGHQNKKYQPQEDTEEKPIVSDNYKKLLPDQVDVLKKWDKITDCRKRCALLALMDSMEG